MGADEGDAEQRSHMPRAYCIELRRFLTYISRGPVADTHIEHLPSPPIAGGGTSGQALERNARELWHFCKSWM